MDRLQLIIDAATDAEFEAIDSAAQRAGLWWKCEHCGWRSSRHRKTCEHCLQSRDTDEAEVAARPSASPCPAQ